MRDQNGDGISERCSGDTGGQFWYRTPSPPARLGRLGVVAPDTIPREGSCAVVRGMWGEATVTSGSEKAPEQGERWTFPGACGEGMARDSAAAEHTEQLFRTCSAAPALTFLLSA